uniref:Omega-agatoxin-Aa5a n=1 Tax=Agelenopsis aperta TaxID=6908 RepID=TX20A_AGEAP|nr:RecName: Full=Omega-agatoxin-Aa5a; Short=Omega-AGTX-Aa5a; AltName: Full=Peptide J2 [Agelenopsis aperta]
EACAGAYKSCDKVKCCHDRRCRCNIAMDNCVCKLFYCELFGTCDRLKP